MNSRALVPLLATALLVACAPAAPQAAGPQTTPATAAHVSPTTGAASSAPVPPESASSPAASSSTAPASPSETQSATGLATPLAIDSRSATASPSPAPDCRKLKCVALSYDDGPSPLTPKLLKAFTDRHATATLFLLGNAAETYPQTVRQAAAAGFEIANHTYDHKPLTDLTDPQVSKEVARTNTILESLTGTRPKLMRPPYAARSKRTDKVVGAQGLAVVVWHNSPEDWLAGHNTAAVITKLTLQRTSRNSIILMHDIHPWTVDAAPAIIDGLQKQGYTLVTVSQLLGTTKPGQLYPR